MNTDNLRFNRFDEWLYKFIFEEKVDLLTNSNEVISQIREFESSARRHMMLDGERYYAGDHDIIMKKRTAIGDGGKLITVDNLPNSIIIDNRYAEMVDQKKNYLLGKPITFKSDNAQYDDMLRDIFSNRFMRLMKNVLCTSINDGIAYVYIGYDETGELSFFPLRGYEVVPIWKDADHTELRSAIRYYPVIKRTNSETYEITKIELYMKDGVYRMVYEGGKLYADENPYTPYITTVDNTGTATSYNWSRLPIIPFKYNANEIPLIKKLKSLQDAINQIISSFQDAMQESPRNSILVLINYDGEDLGEFRRNLATYSAVKIRNDDSMGGGDLKTLQVEVNADNYEKILNILNQKIIENARGYDIKNANLGGNPNQMNILSMYSDIDMDANDIETEFQAAIEDMMFFVNAHLANAGKGNYFNERVNIIFNRNMMVSESEKIDNINKSTDLSLETRLANHPWVKDPQEEMARKKKEQEEELAYSEAFPGMYPPDAGEDIDKSER